MNIADIKIDAAKEAGGEWIDFPKWKGVRFFVRGIECARFKKAMEHETRLDSPRRPPHPDTIYDRNARLLAEHILLGWEGLDLPYDASQAAAMLPNREYRELTSAVIWCANEASLPPFQRWNAPPGEAIEIEVVAVEDAGNGDG